MNTTSACPQRVLTWALDELNEEDQKLKDELDMLVERLQVGAGCVFVQGRRG